MEALNRKENVVDTKRSFEIEANDNHREYITNMTRE